MKTEEIALMVSIVAMLISIGVPIWQNRASNQRSRAASRTLLLQRILEIRSANYLSLAEVELYIVKYGKRLAPDQEAALKSVVPRMQQHIADISELYESWNEDKLNPNMEELDDGFRFVDQISAETREISGLIEVGRASFE